MGFESTRDALIRVTAAYNRAIADMRRIAEAELPCLVCVNGTTSTKDAASPCHECKHYEKYDKEGIYRRAENWKYINPLVVSDIASK